MDARRTGRALASVVALLAGCGASTPRSSTTTPAPHASAPAAPAHPAAAAPDLRGLALGATYADLVAAARHLDDAHRGDATARCILRGSGPYRLEADIALGVRPLPSPPADMDARLREDDTAVRVFSRWGQTGTGTEIALVAFTTAPPPGDAPLLVLFLTDGGVTARATGGAMPAADAGPFPVAQASDRIAALLSSSGARGVVITAEAGVGLDRLHALFAALPEAVHDRVALAVPLAEGTRLPATASAAAPGTTTAPDRASCPGGLPEPAAGTTQGSLSTDAIVGALGPLTEAARQCLRDASGPASAGGRLMLMMRIGPDGHVSKACASEDAIGDPVLRSCVVAAALDTRFPAPSPAGIVDASLPLVLRPGPSVHEAALCP